LAAEGVAVGDKRRKPSVYPGDPVAAALGLDPAEWSVGAGYGKGFLSGTRSGFVSVCHRPTGRVRRVTFYSASKAAARREAIIVARKLVEELRRG
jgi:hypothetical protein